MFVNNRINHVITVSKSVLENYIFNTSISDKTTYLRNVLYPDRIKKLIDFDSQDYCFDFVYIGRLSYPKDPERVAIVASEVLKNNPTVTFGVVGDGEYKDKMKKIFIKENVQDQVTFTGNLRYPYKALKQAKCLLMCSKFEGTPIIALEAMSLGTPIVSTPVDGMVELFEDNNNNGGILSDKNIDLINGVNLLINDKDSHSSYSTNIKKDLI